MTSFEYDEAFGFESDGESDRTSGRFGKIVNWSGGIVSLALVGGLGMWGYQLLVRDVAGVPVVQALEGPMRIAPEDPGGERAAHQGLAVNEIASLGTPSGPADRVALAPAPQELTDEDLPLPSLAAMADDAIDEGTGEEASFEMAESVEGDILAPVEDEALSDTDRAIRAALAGGSEDTLALAAAIADGVPPLSGAGLPPETLDDAAPLRDARGLLRSPRPENRPQRAVLIAASAPGADLATPTGIQRVSAAATGAGAIDVDPASLPVGTRLVQLGAFDSDEVARAQWARIGGKFNEFFDGKRRVVQRAKSGGKTFYRLRAEGFADLGDARRFCSALVAEGADCIPVELR